MDEQPIAIAAIRKRLLNLSHMKLVAFSASRCERLLPHYTTFVHRFKCGDVGPLRTALDRVWDKLGGRPISRLDYEILAKRCSEVIPDPEGFAEVERGYALRAHHIADTVRETLDGCAQRSREKISRAARLALDAVALRLDTPEIGYGRSANAILEDSRAVHELCNQLDLIAVLEMADRLSPSFLLELRASVRVEENRGTDFCREKGRAKPSH